MKTIKLLWLFIFMGIAQSYAQEVIYQYDALNRVEKAIYNNGTEVIYQYDEVNNRVKRIVKKATLSVTPTELTVEATANSTGKFKIQTATNVNWTIENPVSWLSVNNTSGSGSQEITVTATENTAGEQRSATLTVKSAGLEDKIITIIQEKSITQVPTAQFSYLIDNLTVTFTNESSLGKSYHWDFGDGQTSEHENPTITYAEQGTYSVTLSVSNSNGTTIISHEIMVSDGSTPAFTFMSEKAIGEEFSIWIQCQQAKNLAIDWGNGNKIDYSIDKFAWTIVNGKNTGKEIKVYCNDNGKITDLSLPGGLLNHLNIIKLKNLKYLNCQENNLKTLDVSQNLFLENILCSNNQLESIIINAHLQLQRLSCSDNKLQDLLMDRCPSLQYLSCQNNLLNSLDISKNKKLKELYCSLNNIKKLSVEQNHNLEKLICDRNELKELRVSRNNSLYYIRCYGNNMDACAMDNLYRSLFDRTGFQKEGKLFIQSNIHTSYNPGNATSNTQLAVDKGWAVLDYNSNITVSGDATGCPNSIIEKTLESFILHPNPAHTSVTIELASGRAADKVDISDLSGKIIHSQPIASSNTVIDISRLDKGVYLVKAGNVVKKLIVE